MLPVGTSVDQNLEICNVQGGMVACPAVDARPSWLLVLLTVVFIFNQAHRQLLAVLIPAGERGVAVHVNRVTGMYVVKVCFRRGKSAAPARA
jgi:hypothetical protein